MDVYKIAVKIALTNGMSPILAIISRDLLGVHSKVKDIEKNFGGWAKAIGGTAAIMGGVAIIGGLVKIAKHGADVNHQLNLMKIQGMQVGEIQLASAKAMEVSGKVLTSTYSENLAHLRELRYAFGDTPDAMKYLETVTKANAVLNSVKGGGKDQVWELVKSLEQKGLTANPQEFESYVGQMTKAIVASGGKVTPAQFFSAFKYGRTSMLGWDETFVTQYLPRLIQSMSSGGGGGGSGGPGNALMSAFAKVVQGQMPKTAAEEFKRMGLTPGGVQHIKGSSESQVGGGILGKDLFQSSPYEWVQTVLMPKLAEHGITSQNQIIEQISKMFPVRTASQVISEMGLQGRFHEGDQSPFEKDAKLQREAFDQRMSYDTLIKNDYDTMMKAFHAQWKTLNEVVGAPLLEPGGPVVQALAGITSLMSSISQAAQTHPEGLKIVFEALAALAVSLVVAGLIALGAAIAPLLGAGGILVALAAGLAALGALNWDTLKKAFTPDSSNPAADWSNPTGAPTGGGLNAIPPPGKTEIAPGKVSINLDGRKLGEAQVAWIVRDSSGPAQGSPKHDPTRSSAPLDYALVG